MIKHSIFQIDAGDLSSSMRATPVNTLKLILLAGALGAGCGKKENTETNNPGAANRPEAETPKPPPTKPEVVDISKTLPLPSQPLPAAPNSPPPALVAAWEKAGFQAKWKGPDKESGKIIVSDDLEKLDVSKTVLRFEPRRNDFGEASVVLKSLPAPAMSFGLDLSRTEISDVDLKELATMKQLTSLDLSLN